MKKCPNCKTSFEDEDVYCPNCGKKLVSVETDTKVVIEAGSGGINQTENTTTQKNSNKSVSESKPTQNIDMNNKNQESQTSDSSTLRIIVYFLGLGLIILPFIITGSDFGFFWYLLIVGVAFILYRLHRSDKREIGELNVVLLLFIIITFVMLLWGPLNADY